MQWVDLLPTPSPTADAVTRQQQVLGTMEFSLLADEEVVPARTKALERHGGLSFLARRLAGLLASLVAILAKKRR